MSGYCTQEEHQQSDNGPIQGVIHMIPIDSRIVRILIGKKKENLNYF